MKKRDPVAFVVRVLLVGSALFLLSGLLASFFRPSAPTGRPDEGAVASRRTETSAAAPAGGAATIDPTRPLDAERAWREIDPTTTPPSAGRELLLEGRVLDADGLPLDGATVFLDLRPVARAEPSSRPGLGSVQTAGGGWFAFTGPVPAATLPLSLLVQAPGFAPHLAQLDVESGADALSVDDLLLAAGGGISGLVTDTDGAALAGATVTLQLDSNHPLSTWRQPSDFLKPATTDGAGRYRFDDLAPASYRVAAAAPETEEGRLRDAVVVTAGATAPAETIRLGPGGVLIGRVVGPDGRPVADAEVRVRSAGGRARSNQRLESGADGRFRAEHVPAGAVRVEAQASGFLRSVPVELPAVTAEEVVVRLAAGLVVHGTVVDARTQAPVERFAVRLRRLGGDDRQRPGQPGEMLRRQIERLRERAAEADPDRRARDEATARELELRRAVLERAVTADGPGRVAIDPGPLADHPGGRFDLVGADEGLYVVDVASPRHVFTSSAPIPVRRDAPVAAVRIEMERGLAVRGVVVAKLDGTPIADARVDLVRVDEALSAIPDDRLRDGSPSRFGFAFASPGPRGDLLATTRTDAAGRFEVGPAAPGRCFLLASHEIAAEHRSEPFDLASDRDGVTIELGRTAALHGAIRGVPMELARDVQVLAVGGTGVMRTVDPGADLSYRFARLPPGRYLLRAYVKDTVDAPARHMDAIFSSGGTEPAFDVTLAEGEEKAFDLSVELPRMGAIEGTLRINDRAAGGGSVVLRRAPGAPPSAARVPRTLVDAQGLFRLRSVPVGDYVLIVQGAASRQELHREKLSVAADATATLRVELALGGLRGRVESGDSAAAEALDGTLTLLPGLTSPPADLREYGRTNRMQVVRVRGGAFEAADVTAGPVLVVVEIRGRETATTAIDVPVGSTREVVLTAGRAR